MTPPKSTTTFRYKYSILLPLFILLSFLNILTENMDMRYGVYATKPLLLITLSLWFWLNTRDKASAFSRFLLGGLLFSIGGDTFLMFVENEGSQQFFVFGLGCFLLAHLSYLLAFLRYPSTKKSFLKRKPLIILLFLGFFLGNIAFLWTSISADLKIPVTVYSFVIIAMAAGATNLKGKIPSTLFQTLLIGVVLFILSDSMIAVNKFHPYGLNVPYPRVLIMLTYLVSQYLIATVSVRMCRFLDE